MEDYRGNTDIFQLFFILPFLCEFCASAVFFLDIFLKNLHFNDEIKEEF